MLFHLISLARSGVCLSSSVERPAAPKGPRIREARSQENLRITLIDMEGLFDLWVAHYEAIAAADKALLPITPVYFLA
jgi:hypothetical protein